MKPLLAVLAAIALAAPSSPAVKRYQHNSDAIVRVECPGGWGTAVRVGPGLYITAAHVVEGAECVVNGSAITLTALNGTLDYALFIGPPGPIMPVSCEGFKAGRIYVARGFAGGFNSNVLVPWLATELTDGGQVLMLGDAIPGMSGGSLIDEGGRITGIVNRRVASRSLPLSETILCS